MRSIIFLLAVSLLPGLFADDSTVTVKADRFTYKTDLPGIITGSKVQDVKIDAKQCQTWVLKSALKHGASVKKGDVVVSFESSELEEEISDRKRNLDSQKANLLKARKLFEINMKKMELERKKSMLNTEAAVKKSLIYKEKGHELEKINFEQDLVDAKNSLEYQKEELDQLKKMYDEDKITEETEEIVLKRQLNRVESLSKRMKSRELAVEEALNIKLPASLFNADYSKQIALLDDEKNKVEWEVFAVVEKNKLEAAELAYKKAQESFEELKKDKQFLSIKSEYDGVVYYGKLSSGKWVNQVGTEYSEGQKFLKGTSLFSVVASESFEFIARVEFSQVANIVKDAGYFVEVSGLGARKLTLSSIATVPNNGVFEAVFKFEDSNGLFHGIGGKARVIRQLGNKVISVPNSAVKAEENDPTKLYVEVVKEGQVSKQYVSTGTESNGKAVILSGLEEGSTVKIK